MEPRKLIRITIFFIPLCFLPYSEAQGTMSDLVHLTDTLFSNYSKKIRPAYYLNDTVTIDITFILLSILDLDEVKGTITLSAVIIFVWNDYRLQWNPSDYGGITHFEWNSSDVWKPSIFLLSSASNLEEFGSGSFQVRIYSSGSLSYSPGKLVTSTCTVNMSKFPRDSQICSLILYPWNNRYPEITLLYSKKYFEMSYYSSNGEWDITKTSISPYLEFSTSPNFVKCAIYLTRKSGYFTISMIVPIFLLCLLNPFVFLLPASSGERISYTITMFLSLAVYMTLIGDNMPKVSEPMAGISFFLLLTMCYSCLLIVLTIFTLRCEATRDINKFPKWLVTLVIWLQREGKENEGENKHGQLNDSNEKGATLPEDKEVDSEDNKVKEQELMCDIRNFIDGSLFVITVFIIVVAVIWYLVRYYK